jgi:hypothetical protein
MLGVAVSQHTMQLLCPLLSNARPTLLMLKPCSCPDEELCFGVSASGCRHCQCMEKRRTASAWTHSAAFSGQDEIG